MGFITSLIMPLRLDTQQAAVGRYLGEHSRRGCQTDEVILVQCVEDVYYLGLFGQIALTLQTQRSYRVDQYVLRSLRVGEASSLLKLILSRWIINPLHNVKWTRLYNSFCNRIGYRSALIMPLADASDLLRAWQIWKGIKDKRDLMSLEIDGVPVGDLVNDSYIRFKPAPFVQPGNFYLLMLLWQAFRDVRRAREYFAQVKPKLYLTSYSTYIQHGIPVRVALQHGVRVISFGNYQEFAKELQLTDWVHTRNPDNYSADFKKLNDQAKRLALAESALITRISGGVDNATAYMKSSAYKEAGEPVPDVCGAVVVFLHDFFDSPHVYKGMVFQDFWEWICFTIEILTQKGIPYFVKPHPNQIGLSQKILDQLKKQYPAMRVVSPKVTNKQLVEAGLVCAITVYGTVAHEMAYLGVPSIACAHHPHVSFGFCRTAESLEEYAALLRESNQQDRQDKEILRRQSLEFYYMHNLYLSEGEKRLRDLASALRIACHNGRGGMEIAEMLGKFGDLAGFTQFVGQWLSN